MFHMGKAQTGAEPAASKYGTICQKALDSGQGNYLANLALYPGLSASLSLLRGPLQSKCLQSEKLQVGCRAF